MNDRTIICRLVGGTTRGYHDVGLGYGVRSLTDVSNNLQVTTKHALLREGGREISKFFRVRHLMKAGGVYQNDSSG